MKLKQNNIKTKRIKYYNTFLFFGLCLVSCLVSITQVFAEGGGSNSNNNNTVSSTSSANASVTVSAACSFNVIRSAGYDDEKGYTGTLANNASIEITGSTFTTICNDSGGYAIYAIGYGNNTLGETDLISANGSSNITTSSNPASGTSYWQMKLTAATDNQPVLENGYGNYSAIPSTYTKVASYSSITDTASSGTRTGQAITAHYKAYASSTQPADTYTGAVKYTMVHPNTNIPNEPRNCTANKICYYPNAGNTVADTMGDQSIDSSDVSATLWASNFKRSGYGFAGWSDAYDYVVNEGSESNPNAQIYGPNEDITFEAGEYDGANNRSAGLSLYAIWVKPAKDYQNDELTFQTTNLLNTQLTETANDTLANKPTGYVTALRDKRDGQVYAVAKLADENYWMIENLRLEAEYTRGSYYHSLAQGYGGVFIGLADPETGNFNTATPNSLYNTENSATMPRFDNSNTAHPTGHMTDPNQNIYSYGNSYTWAAAIANTVQYGFNNVITTTSICPKGWHLPYGNNTTDTYGGNTKGGFYYLGIQLGEIENSTMWRTYPNNFITGGPFGVNLYKTATTSNWGGSYHMRLIANEISPGTTSTFRYQRAFVRCIIE